ncbi:hypothetical protein QNN00_16480 [Bacillus velezensis]|nr:hypothetical protein [Bacillus velezensis]
MREETYYSVRMRASRNAPMSRAENTFPAENGSSLTAVYRKR